MLRKLAIILLTFTALSCFGENFIVTHKTCKILGKIKERTGRSDLYEVLEKELNLKNFEISYVTQKHIFKKGDLILSLESEVLRGGLFPPCFVEIVIKEESADKNFFSAGIKRALPRNLSTDNYLCKLAVRDVLYHLPYCQVRP